MPGFNINGTGGEVISTTDIHRSYRWQLDSILGAGITISRDQLRVAVELTPPSLDFSVLQIQGMSLEYKIPQKPVFSNIDITFYDFIGLTSAFEEWMKKIWNHTKGLFEGKAPTNLKGDISFSLLDNAGKEIETFEMFGVWPKKMSHSKLSMTDDSLKTLIIEFVYDYYEHKDKKSKKN